MKRVFTLVFITLVVIAPATMTFMASTSDYIVMEARTPENGNWSIERIMIQAETEGIILRITSTDVVHSIEIPDFEISVELVPGEVMFVELPPMPQGLYSFFCHIPCSPLHLDMKGIIEAL